MDTSLLEIFSARLRETRGDMMQATFAQKIGVSRASLSSYENGSRIPDIETLKHIHEETGVSLYYLLGLTDSRDDALATAQKDTGLSEVALKHFASNPLSAKVINYLVDCGSLFAITSRAAILHDDTVWMKRNPPEEWSAVLQAMRDDHFEIIEKEMNACFIAMLLEGKRDDELFGVPSKQLPTIAALGTLNRMREIRDRLQLLADHDPESKALAEKYTRTIDAMLSIKEAPDAQETPEQ